LSLMLLYPAGLLLISRFGWVMASLLATAWLSEIVLLPALLAGPLGRLIEDVESRTIHSSLTPEFCPATGSIRPHKPMGARETQKSSVIQ